MDYTTTLQALRRLKVETGSLPCYCRDCVNGSKFQWRGLGRAAKGGAGNG